ncbi:MAG: hypothetical protein M1813_008998 [Trichoglossum hirsutum]|nr:MAG: hypothetical protein M1813_008998 [Trichoglossum hirsutum]
MSCNITVPPHPPLTVFYPAPPSGPPGGPPGGPPDEPGNGPEPYTPKVYYINITTVTHKTSAGTLTITTNPPQFDATPASPSQPNVYFGPATVDSNSPDKTLPAVPPGGSTAPAADNTQATKGSDLGPSIPAGPAPMNPAASDPSNSGPSMPAGPVPLNPAASNPGSPGPSIAAGPALPDPAAPSAMTVGNIPISLSPSDVVISGQTFAAGAAPTSVVIGGQTFALDPSRVIAPGTTIALPQPGGNSPAPTPIVIGGATFSVTVVGGRTYAVGPDASPTTIVANGRTVSIGPDGINLVAGTGPAAATVATIGGLAFSVGSSIAVVGGSTFDIGPGATPTVRVINGQTVSIGPGAIGLAGATIKAQGAPSAVTAGGITFSQGPSVAVIDGTTFAVGPGAPLATKVINGQTVNIGPSGIGFPATTVAPLGVVLAPITAGGIAFSQGASIAVIDGTTFTVGPGATPTTKVVNGQTVSIGPGGIGFAATTVAPLGAVITPITAGGITFSQGASIAVIDGTTFTVGPGATPTTKVVNGQTVSIGPGGIGFAATTVAPLGAVITPITAGGITFSQGASIAVIDGTTFTVGPGATPTTKVINGQTVSIGPGGIGFAAMTVPPPGAAITPITAGGITFSQGASIAVIDGTTFTVGPGATPTTKVVNGQTISLGPGGIGLASTTIVPSGLVTRMAPDAALTPITAGGITFSEGPSIVVIDGTTFTIPGATPTTKVVNGQTISIGPHGIGFATTTIPPPIGSLSTMTAGGVTFSGSSSVIVIDGTAFTIGPGATPTMKVVNGQTISLGPNGIGFATTTMPPPSSGSTAATTVLLSTATASVSAAPFAPKGKSDARSNSGRGKGVFGILAAVVVIFFSWT